MPEIFNFALKRGKHLTTMEQWLLFFTHLKKLAGQFL